MEQLTQWIAIGLTAGINLGGFVFLIGRQSEHLRQTDSRLSELQADIREIRTQIAVSCRAQCPSRQP